MSRNSPSGTFAGCTRTSAGGHQAPRAVNGRRGWMFGPKEEDTTKSKAADDDEDEDDSLTERPVHDVS